ncbi:MAG: super-infection exclusion protein B, partial [Ignavibacteriaceae bacterium]
MIIEILSKIFDVIVNKIALPIAVLCALLLFIPKSFLRDIEVLTIVDSYRGVIWIVFLFSILVYSYEKGKTLFSYIKSKFDK